MANRPPVPLGKGRDIGTKGLADVVDNELKVKDAIKRAKQEQEKS